MDHSDTLFATLDTIKQVKDRFDRFWLGFIITLLLAIDLALLVPYVVGWAG